MVLPVSSHHSNNEENRRREFRVPVDTLRGIQVCLWTAQRKFPVEIIDASPSGVLISIPCLDELEDSELQLLVLEVSHKQSHFVISGHLARRHEAGLALRFDEERLSTFVAASTSHRQWNAFVIWLQSAWIREQRATEALHTDGRG